MPYRKPKRSYVLPVVTTLAVAAPLAALTMSDSPDYRATTGTELAAVPAQLAEVVLNSAPDIVLPLRELTGLDLPDLHLSDLRMLPLPASIPIPEGLPLPPGVQLPKEIPLPKLNGPHPATPGQQSAPGLNTAPGSNATPGQGLAPGQTPFSGQATAPTQNSFPGQAVTPNQNNIPGRTAPNNSPGQAAAPTQNSIPGQAVAPGQNTNPGQASAPVQNSIPGQAAAPAQNTNPGRAAAPGQNTDPGQASAPVQNPVPGQVATPGQMPNSGQTAPAPTQSAPGGARFIADPSHLEPGTTPDTPALAPGAVPPELTDQVGAQVKELSRETPFSVVALTAADLTNTKAMLRARQSDGSWGPWFNAEPVDTRRTDRSAAGGKTGTEPLYVGTTNAVQMLVTRKNAAATAPADTVAPDPAAQPAPRSDDPAQMSGVDLTAVLIDPGRGAIDGALHKVAAPAPGGGPKVISREGWGADESIRCEEPTYDDGPGKDGLGGIAVHHTAGRNDYTEEESAGIVRAIYTYHAKTLGWCDIGYNALVDKYGQIFEGRAGGLDRAVQGAHAGGFNENTAGVALMGNYTEDPPTEESIEAIGNFIGWRSKVAHLNPEGKTIMYSEGTEYTSYAMGQAVNLPIVFAHRDVGNTTCPGDAAYEQMDRIREIAASVAGGAGVTNSGTGDGTDSYANNGTGTDGTANSPAPQAAPRNKPDLSALAALTKKLLGMVNENPIAKHWADGGGPRGPLGAAQTEPLPAAQGQQYAKFANGYVYTAPDGKVIEVLGKILDRFLQLGGDAGVLGLPTSDAYNVPNGQRADFQYGSLILNQVTGIVTTVWKTYNDTYQQDAGRPAPAAAPAPAPAPAESPAPAEVPAPAEAPAPADAPAPQPDALQFPAPEDFLPTPAPEPAG